MDEFTNTAYVCTACILVLDEDELDDHLIENHWRELEEAGMITQTGPHHFDVIVDALALPFIMLYA